ncbi:hypothetical protein C9374_009327 [Naegleria lovaniensis]|uniref:Uncharacterized protein n=1 Tax=Naegleria lovaniensis TaxID=51637 RepID=A0AA88GHS1_NAELO|nr:uncharacterized protein C9374_009327 [Naegleria lovaniensis]KAG2377416.1 hypothetical protein C9374_009327 [Naegleria lovaniensis]
MRRNCSGVLKRVSMMRNISSSSVSVNNKSSSSYIGMLINNNQFRTSVVAMSKNNNNQMASLSGLVNSSSENSIRNIGTMNTHNNVLPTPLVFLVNSDDDGV